MTMTTSRLANRHDLRNPMRTGVAATENIAPTQVRSGHANTANGLNCYQQSF
jgi:hypothetical protein